MGLNRVDLSIIDIFNEMYYSQMNPGVSSFQEVCFTDRVSTFDKYQTKQDPTKANSQITIQHNIQFQPD
jgi:hypothetical protein